MIRQNFKVIQVYRALAAIFVVLFHFSDDLNRQSTSVFGGFFQIGYTGVDFFFVLSGFIITYIHYHDIENRSNLALFFKKRFIRIYPIYWVISIAYLILYISVKDKEFLNRVHEDSTFLIKSILLIKQKTHPFVHVAWSLCYEIFFYLVFGLFIISGKIISRALFILWAISILLLNLFFTVDNSFLAFAFSLYTIQFLFGCLVAYLIVTGAVKSIFAYFVAGIMLLGIMYYGLFTKLLIRDDVLTTLGLGVSFSLILLGSLNLDSRYTWNKSLLKIGDASYVLYLIHLIPKAIALKILNTLMLRFSAFKNYTLLIDGYILVSTAAIVIMAVMIHNYIELPLLDKLKPFVASRKKKFQALPDS